jgi:hypothetical protein
MQTIDDNPLTMKHLMNSSAPVFLRIIIVGLMSIILPLALFAEEISAGERALKYIENHPLKTSDSIAWAKLERPLVFENALIVWPDRDLDGLDDAMETSLAERVRPIFIFDSNETALEKDEPIMLFQARPANLSNPDNMTIRIRWVLLFRKSGVYGPCSALCGGGHAGDIKTVTFLMTSKDKGITWETVKITLDEKETISWEKGGYKIGSRVSHPQVFVSSGRHNLYFFPAQGGIKSPYSLFGCCDNIDGKGAVILPEIKNAGEPEAHPEPVFADSLAPLFPGCSAWGKEYFFSIWAGKIRDRWLTDKIIPREASLCSIESFVSPGSFIRHKRYRGEVTKIISARDRLDARFRIIQAAGGRNVVMIESVNYPGYFLADEDGRLSLIKPGKDDERKAACFEIRKGFKGRNTVSFKSTARENSYIRESDGHLFVESRRLWQFRKESSFRTTSPQ